MERHANKLFGNAGECRIRKTGYILFDTRINSDFIGIIIVGYSVTI